MDRARVTIFSAVCASAMTSAAWADGTATADLRAELAELRTQVAALQQSSGENWLTEQRAEEVRGLVQDVLTDADTRASLLQSGMTGGYDGGFFLASSDGNFKLKINGQVQFRFVFNYQDDGPDDSSRWGFENRRTKLKFKGNIVNPDWTYGITGAFARVGGAFFLEDAWIAHNLGDGWSLKVGQFKAPFLREELVSSSAQLLVDRSLVNEEFNQGFSQGIELSYKADQFRFAAMYSDGFKSRNTAWSNYDTEFAITGRFEFLAMGDWKQFKGFTSKPGSENGLLIGAAVHYQKDEYGTSAPGGNDDEAEDLRFTVDGSFAGDGFNIFGSFIYQTLDQDAGSDPDRMGVVVQGGLYLNEDWELFCRYEWGDFDTSGVEDLSVITFGANNYLAKGIKWTTDVGIGLDAVSIPWAATGVGWRPDAADDDGQLVVRSQLQVLF